MNDDDYSATQLGSHWFEHPARETAPVRAEGEVLRFGPGVTEVAARRAGNTLTAVQIWHGTLPGVPAPRPVRSRWPFRYMFAAVVLAAVLAFLAWREYGPRVAVRDVKVGVLGTPGRSIGCNGTADIVGVVRTDGRPGTLTYHWERSDGTRSAPLRERLTRGQEAAELRLLWTFHGSGTYHAEARLVITSPTVHTSATAFTYRCG